VTITDDEFVADFTGSQLQVPGPISNTRTGLTSGVRAILKALTHGEVDSTVPINAARRSGSG
jgi:N-methylhydantoinase B